MITNQLINHLNPTRINETSPASKTTPADAAQSFGAFLKDAIDSVADQEKQVKSVTDDFLIGKADVSQLMIVSEQAQLSLQLTSQIRNKVIEAYQEIMRTQL
ncbi:flagellar hook-basal body protein FliE [Paenibacillus darwinianus]|uniref:Flagellar hook-basal body complex protein FliE n=1 Tax=Paenibacillus darwinianus TaxID=1380763 RepID=A0A9W5S3K0_9BACL|nr:flagellar hook-basal body complex protein FliE [Paenibacillus darwinianus]EXX91381.1 flagellar hook-basal body protein FliE [Paenibacillus darwinianus]EXX92287.1 flagellar hook-basal body protein FliE [Paenibacillus darwinianus]EXX92859.1 flagellar hook-basal body protein FliE [Paenibacillus darwinianus]